MLGLTPTGTLLLLLLVFSKYSEPFKESLLAEFFSFLNELLLFLNDARLAKLPGSFLLEEEEDNEDDEDEDDVDEEDEVDDDVDEFLSWKMRKIYFI